MSKEQLIILIVLLVNVFAFLAYGLDKWKSKGSAARISERFLLIIAFLGGSVGAWSGMYFFHHKTKHWKFVLGIPMLFILHIVVVLYFLNSK